MNLVIEKLEQERERAEVCDIKVYCIAENFGKVFYLVIW